MDRQQTAGRGLAILSEVALYIVTAILIGVIVEGLVGCGGTQEPPLEVTEASMMASSQGEQQLFEAHVLIAAFGALETGLNIAWDMDAQTIDICQGFRWGWVKGHACVLCSWETGLGDGVCTTNVGQGWQ